MDFKKYLEKSGQQIDEELDEILSEFLNEAKKTNIKLLPFALGLLNSSRGGKRIRGVLVKLGYELAQNHLGGVMASASLQPATIRGEITKIGAAFELLHTAILIHDDVIDKSPTRRGKPSLYQSLGGEHLGISQAITLGDIAFYLPIKIITDTNFLGEYRLKALNLLSQIIINTGWGQILDVEGVKEDKDFINLFKTAKYTVSGPLQIGAILAGADEELIRGLGEFGDSLGIAFQIKDDILDEEKGEKDSAKIKAEEYIDKAKKIIPELTKDINLSKLLTQMAEYMVERKK